MMYYLQFYAIQIWPFTRLRRNVIFLRSCLVNAKRMLLFMFEQVFLLVGEVWSIYNADTQCTAERKEKAKGQRKFLCLNLCLAIKYEFSFTVSIQNIKRTNQWKEAKRTLKLHFLKNNICFILAVLGLSCGLQDLWSLFWHVEFSAVVRNLFPWPRMEPRPSALGVQSPSHWTTRKVLVCVSS